tara:strand:- start:11883 stop:12047 length:165 start_codon:yes stop_codon:yes gene_type:complete
MSKKVSIKEPVYTNIQKQSDSNVESKQKKKYLDDIIKDSFLKDYFSIVKIKILK